jgi:hypothetical protein
MPLQAEIAKHKWAVGGVALVGLFVLYILLKGGSSQSASPVAALAQANEEENQLQAASDAQAQQTNAQLQAVQLQAQAANNQTIAAVQTQNNQTDASLIAALAGNKTQQQENSLEAQTQNEYISSSLQATENTNATNLSAYNAGVGYQSLLAQLQAALTSQGLTESSGLASQQLQDQFSITQQAQNAVNEAGLNHGTNSLEEQLTAIESEILGQPGVGVAAENANATGSAASASQFASLINGITNLGGKVATGLLA